MPVLFLASIISTSVPIQQAGISGTEPRLHLLAAALHILLQTPALQGTHIEEVKHLATEFLMRFSLLSALKCYNCTSLLFHDIFKIKQDTPEVNFAKMSK